MWTKHAAFILGITFTVGGIFAAENSDVAGSSMTVKLTRRTIKTDEKRWEAPDGRMVGSFEQFVKGNGTPEDLKQIGPYAKDDDKEVYTLEEKGVTEIGKRVENRLTITRDLVGGILTEILRRTPKKEAQTPEEKIELLGGLPGVVETRTNADGSQHIDTWKDPNPGPNTKPDDHIDIPGDGDTGGGGGGGGRPTRPKFDDFINLHVKIKDNDPTPPDDKGPGDKISLDVDKINVITAPPTVVTPPVTPPATPPAAPTGRGSFGSTGP